VDVDAAVTAELHRLRRRRPDVSGSLLAGRDGLLVASDLPQGDAHSVAALAAAGLGLSNRFAETTGYGALREYVVRAGAGTVVIYPAGRHALLTVVGTPDVDVDRLYPEARPVAQRLGALFDAGGSQAAELLADPYSPLADPHAPLAVRTPMATLPGRARPDSGVARADSGRTRPDFSPRRAPGHG
jgi:predicted regulator of Ras-like GTPase activity (Roadblock/LC7/MglB family)